MHRDLYIYIQAQQALLIPSHQLLHKQISYDKDIGDSKC